MKTGKRFSPEIRERSVRMVFDQEREYSSQWACIESIAGKVGCSSQTLKTWVSKAEQVLGVAPCFFDENKVALGRRKNCL
jgi:transposase